MCSNQAFRVGFGRRCISPEESVPLAGYGNTSMRMSESILSDLYATCVAFTDSEDNTVLLFHNDLIASKATYMLPIREAISQATGVPVGQVMIAATHTHSAPDLLNKEQPSIPRYLELLKTRLPEAAVEAMADRKPATMSTGFAYTKMLNFNRHYFMNDGSVVGDNFGDPEGKTYLTHITEADPLMQVVKFTREGGKDILLVNWQSHPHRTGNGGKGKGVSADIIGAMRDTLEEATGCNFAYFTGGAGNINPHSRIAEENITADYLEQGAALAACAVKALENLRPLETGKIRCAEVIYQGTINHTQDHMLQQAKEIRKLFTETNDRKLCRLTGTPYGIHSAYHAGAIIRRVDMPQFKDVEMHAVALGDLAFVTAPYEMFDVNAKQVRDRSPFKTTFVISCANDANNYIPSSLGYFHGCYESDNSLFHPGTGEELALKYVEMLKALYDAQ